MGIDFSAPRTDPNLPPLDYFGFDTDEVQKIIETLNSGDFLINLHWLFPSAKDAHDFIDMLKGLLKKDRYRIMELMTTRAGIASVCMQLKNIDDKGRRGAMVLDTNGHKTNWILEFALEKGGVWPKVMRYRLFSCLV